MDATEDLPIGFDPMPNNPTVTMWTDWGQRVDRALKAIKRVMLTIHDHFKGLVILVFANFACTHTELFRTSVAWRGYSLPLIVIRRDVSSALQCLGETAWLRRMPDDGGDGTQYGVVPIATQRHCPAR